MARLCRGPRLTGRSNFQSAGLRLVRMPTPLGPAQNSDVAGVPPVALRTRPRGAPLVAVAT